MNKYVALIFIIVCILFACKSNKQKQIQKKKFFPVADYIESEINYVDSLPLGIIKYSTHNNRTDTAYIRAAAFNESAKDFISADLQENIFENDFSETSFIDESIQAITFTYAAKNNKLELQRVDVLATAGEGSNKVSSIYLEKSIQKNDTLITEKLLWKTKKGFQIVTIKKFSDKRPEIEQLKVVWNPE
jgi:c-di-AMP phosphodiesterase-like protein